MHVDSICARCLQFLFLDVCILRLKNMICVSLFDSSDMFMFNILLFEFLLFMRQ